MNAAGNWAKRIGEMAGVALAAGAVEHQYIVTEKKIETPGDPDLPRPRPQFLPEARREGSFAIGGWERGAPARWPEGVPFEFATRVFPGNFDRIEPIMLSAPRERLPVLNEVGIQTLDQRGRSRSRPTASRSWGSRPSSTISSSPAASRRALPRQAEPARR